jgi:hypothetical protein
MPSADTRSIVKVWDQLSRNSLPLLPEIVSQELGNPLQMKRLEPKSFVYLMQYDAVQDFERLRNGSHSFKSGLSNDTRNGGINVIAWWPSGAMLVMEIFPYSGDLPNPERNSTQGISFLSDMTLSFSGNLVGVKVVFGEKCDENPLLQFHQDQRSRFLLVLSTVVWS